MWILITTIIIPNIFSFLKLRRVSVRQNFDIRRHIVHDIISSSLFISVSFFTYLNIHIILIYDFFVSTPGK